VSGDFFKKTFVIAEIGGNHEGNFDYAKKLLFDAIASGVDAIKFQTYKPEKIVNKVLDKARFDHFGKFALDDYQYVELAKLCKKNNVHFMSSVWDKDSLDILDPYINIHKIGSGDMTNYPLIRKIIQKGKPTIISTAMSTLEEIQSTVDFILSVDKQILSKKKLGILQCVAMYGEPMDEYANLRVIETLKNTFPEAVIGYSDHTLGSHACLIAVGMGSKILEIHFTDDKERSFRDHHISLDKKEMKSLIKKIRKTEVMLGNKIKKPVSEIEDIDRIKEFRRACYLNQDLRDGDIIKEEHLTTLRPNIGIDAIHYFDLIGKRLNRDISLGEHLKWDYFDTD
tara:strand:+ start:850 stop:1869 length:1020 start_codon:yes stop_codon:yes gene_type:complete